MYDDDLLANVDTVVSGRDDLMAIWKELDTHGSDCADIPLLCTDVLLNTKSFKRQINN